jgi:hypothetical protein
MPGQDNLHTHFGGAVHDRIEVFDLKPQQYAVAVGPVITVADPAMIVFHFKTMQLKNKLAIRNQPLVFPASMIAADTQQTLIPPAAGFYV